MPTLSIFFGIIVRMYSEQCFRIDPLR
jgi:hypothetical protein